MKKSNLEKYFQNSNTEITLPGIEEKMTLPYGVWFRYDGEVNSLTTNFAKTELIIRGMIETEHNSLQKVLEWPMDWLETQAAAQVLGEKNPHLKTLLGYCNPHQIYGMYDAYVIAKRKGLPENKSIFTDGHESGEFLQAIKHQQLLQEFLTKEGIEIDVSKYSAEDFADIGGLLALRKASQQNQIKLIPPTFKGRPAVLDELLKPFGF